jgi:hypothetical protein
MAHVFFASYARLDNDKKRLRNVILDLRERVRIKLGAANPSTARTSSRCFDVGSRQSVRPPLPLRVIIPVVWDVSVIPRAVSKYQQSDEKSGFPSDYRQQGLLALKRNKTQKYQSRYDQALDALTTVIYDAATAPTRLPSLVTPVVFEELPGVFDNPGAYNVGIATLHDSGARWELRPGTTIRSVVEEMAAKEGLPWRAIKVGDDIEKVLQKALLDREIVAIIADEKSISAGAWKARLSIHCRRECGGKLYPVGRSASFLCYLCRRCPNQAGGASSPAFGVVARRLVSGGCTRDSKGTSRGTRRNPADAYGEI